MDVSNYIVPNDTDFCLLECKEAFDGLTDKEKQYAHYLSRASWYGGLVVLYQTSPESPGIYLLLTKMIRHENTAELLETATGVAELTPEEFQSFLVYAAAVFANSGNYKSFGDSKIIPGLPKEKMEKLVKASKAYKKDCDQVTELWSSIGDAMYSLTARETQLGLGDDGITTYFSSNCTLDDAAIAKQFLTEKQIPAWNTRCFKDADGKFEIRLASVETSSADLSYIGDHEITVEDKTYKFCVTRGDYSQLLKLVNDNLILAKEYVANENQASMLTKYAESFTTGSCQAHKDASRFWIKDKGPVVESYIGFIENYRDPVSSRAEFEGFVAMVNKEMSAKFSTLVDNAEKFLELLPWSKELEKDKFLMPDFTSLDVLTFGGSGIPAGINIPNYDEIRQMEGFKNVSLGNVLSSSYKGDKAQKITFLSPDDKETLSKWKAKSFEVQVGLHELLGHGSGKLFSKKEDGTFNFDTSTTKNPLTNEPISSWYEPGETYSNKFPVMSSAYEECRAECVGLVLCLDDDVLSVFGYSGEDAQNIIYINWLSMARAGLLALEFYSPDTKSWRQAHMQARYAILQVMLQAEGLVTITECTGEDGQPDLLLSLDKTKIDTVGKKAIADFLLKIQVYKATADYTAAKSWFQDEICSMTDNEKVKFTTWRQIVMNRKVSRKMLVQCNTSINDDAVTLTEYEPTAAGLVQSVADRFSSDDVTLDVLMQELVEKDKHLWA